MNTRREYRWPLRLLAFFMALCVGFSAWLFLLHRALTDETLYEEAALKSLPDREKRFEQNIQALADEAGVEAQAILDFYPSERRKQIAEDGALWVLGIISGHESSAPDTSAKIETEYGQKTLESALTSLLPGSRFKAEAKAQELSAKIETFAARNLLPMRTTLLHIADEKTENYRSILKKLLRYVDLAAWILAGLAFLFALLLCLIWRWERYGIAYAGAGMAAGGLGGAAILIPILFMNIPGIVAEVSDSFSAEVQYIISNLMTRHCIICGILFVVGFVLFLLCRQNKRSDSHEV